MKRLLLKKLIVISRSEQSSLEVPFKKGLNIILGGNKTGKSSLIKSIFTALGCDCSKIEKDWKNLISTYLLYFEYGDEQYCVLRCGKEFSIMKEEKNNYTCVINTEKFQLFCDKLMEIFEVNMQCVISNNSEIINVTTPLLFRFQYIDQDDGWSDIGNEFKNVRYIKDWKGDTNKFITGYLNNDYYKLKAKKIQLSNDKEEKLKELKSNEMFVNSISHDLKKKSQLENLNQLNTVDDVQKKLIKLRNDTDDLRKKEYSIKEKMINFFTLKRSKRLELIKKGYIVFGLVFSSSYINNSNLIRTRIIFSPSYELADNKGEMLAIADKINEWVDSVNFKKLTMKEKKLYQAIISDEEEPNYIQIPESIIGNKLVYLSLIFANKDDFLNGMVPIIINRKISKEILLVPQAMYSNEYIESLEEDN